LRAAIDSTQQGGRERMTPKRRQGRSDVTFATMNRVKRPEKWRPRVRKKDALKPAQANVADGRSGLMITRDRVERARALGPGPIGDDPWPPGTNRKPLKRRSG
jgi:hypothetical protein